MHCIRAHQSATTVVVIVYCTYYKRLYFSLSDDICSSARGKRGKEIMNL